MMDVYDELFGSGAEEEEDDDWDQQPDRKRSKHTHHDDWDAPVQPVLPEAPEDRALTNQHAVLFRNALEARDIKLDTKSWKCPLQLKGKALWEGLQCLEKLVSVVPVCKGNSTGFDSVSSLYQHCESKGIDCPFHSQLRQYLKDEYKDEIVHLNTEKIKKEILVKARDSESKLTADRKLQQLIERTGKLDPAAEVFWPPCVLLSNASDGFSSKNKIMERLKEFFPVSAIPLYRRDRSSGSRFTGEALVEFNNTFNGYFQALDACSALERSDRWIRARLVGKMHYEDVRRCPLYSKITNKLKKGSILELVIRPASLEASALRRKKMEEEDEEDSDSESDADESGSTESEGVSDHESETITKETRVDQIENTSRNFRGRTEDLVETSGLNIRVKMECNEADRPSHSSSSTASSSLARESNRGQSQNIPQLEEAASRYSSRR